MISQSGLSQHGNARIVGKVTVHYSSLETDVTQTNQDQSLQFYQGSARSLKRKYKHSYMNLCKITKFCRPLTVWLSSKTFYGDSSRLLSRSPFSFFIYILTGRYLALRQRCLLVQIVYPSNRKQRTSTANSPSTIKPVPVGVPQSSVLELCCLLFL